MGFAIADFSALRYLRDSTVGTDLQTRIDLVADPEDPKDLFSLVNPLDPVGVIRRTRALRENTGTGELRPPQTNCSPTAVGVNFPRFRYLKGDFTHSSRLDRHMIYGNRDHGIDRITARPGKYAYGMGLGIMFDR